MDNDQARARLLAERAEVERSLRGTASAERREQLTNRDPGDAADTAQSLTAQGNDKAILGNLSERLDAIDRAFKRLDDGTYGLSIRSGQPIPDERLEADPAAELTIGEARQAS